LQKQILFNPYRKRRCLSWWLGSYYQHLCHRLL